jgi:hypothetical protein
MWKHGNKWWLYVQQNWLELNAIPVKQLLKLDH